MAATVNLIDREMLARMLGCAAARMRSGADELSDIDSRFGDGDHGVTVTKIAGAIDEACASWADASIHDFLLGLGDAIMAVGGGSAGPLYGTMVGGMATAVPPDCTAIDAPMLKGLYAAMSRELSDISPAKPGDKTMVDALAPAVEAAQAAPDDIAAIGSAAAAAGRAGAERSRGFPSKFGRARMYGDQTIGTPDAGAVSTALFLEGFAEPLDA